MGSGEASAPGSGPGSTGRRRCRCGRALTSGRGGRGLCHKCWQAFRHRMIAYGKWDPMYIPIGPTVEHLSQLSEAGIGTVRVAELAGLNRHTVQRLRAGGRKKCARHVAEGILSIPIPEEAPSAFSELHAPGAMIPNVGTMRRLQALAMIGYDLADLGERLGMKLQQVSMLRLGHSPKVTIRTARAVAELFEDLQVTAGPSRAAQRVAERNGWFLPLAWDEDAIDDPAAKPCVVSKRDHTDFATLVADYRSLDLTDDEIAERMHSSVESFHSRLRHNRIPLGRRYRDIEDTKEVLRRNSHSRRALRRVS